MEFMNTIWIACGGTGGHLFPGLAIAQELRRRGHTVRIFLSNKPVDEQVMKSYSQFESVKLPTIGWPGLRLRSFTFAWKFFQAYRQCLKDMSAKSPQAVIGMGGFLSAAPLLAAAKKNIPAYLHESNAIPGRVTRWLAPKMTQVFLGFKECERYLPDSANRFTGTPVRESLHKMKSLDAAKTLGLDEDKKTLVIIGGSQGAHGLNMRILEVAEHLKDEWQHWQILHLTGANDAGQATQTYKQLGIRAKVLAFCDQMEAVYSLADLIVARSGAASLTEIAMYGLPSLLVPYPSAADDHQSRNAEVFVAHGASKLLNEREATAHDFERELRALMNDEVVRNQMSENTKNIFIADAAGRIAKEVEYAIA